MTTQKPMAVPLSEWREQQAQADKTKRSIQLAAAALCIIGAASYWQSLASSISVLKPDAAQEVNTAPVSSHRLDVGAPQVKVTPAVKISTVGTRRVGGPLGDLSDMSNNAVIDAANTMASAMVSASVGFHRNSKAYEASPTLEHALMTDPGAQKAVAAMISATYKVSYTTAALSVKESIKGAKKQQIDPILLLALIGRESSFNNKAESDYGAQGIMQVVPRWHGASMKKVGITNILEAPTGKQIELGAVVLKEFLGPGNTRSVEVGLQHYNQGANATIDPTWKYATGVLSNRNALKATLVQYMNDNSPKHASLNTNL